MSAGSRGTDVPKTDDPDEIIVIEDKSPVGGDKTVGVPQYVLTVKNFPGTPHLNILVLEDSSPLRDDDSNEILL